MNGFLCIDKPQGPSSFAAIKKVRSVFRERQVGHTGTLDPAATGLLVIALGRSTKVLPYLTVSPKVYEFGIQFGDETDSLDSEGAIIARGGRIPSELEIREALPRFYGHQHQVVPRFSAVKIDGVRAYKLARAEVDFQPKEREFTVLGLKLLGYNRASAQALFCVTASTGMYVRALARDIARSLGTLGYARSIRRLGIGDFSLGQAIALDTLTLDDSAHIISVDRAFEKHPARVVLSAAQQRIVELGRDIPLENPPAEQVIGFSPEGQIIAVLNHDGKRELFHPIRVFSDHGGGAS